MRDGLVRVMQKAGLSVSVSEEEGQRVLDLARGVDNSEEMREQREDERFKEDLGRYERGEMHSNERFTLGMPRGVAKGFLPNLPIEMSQKVLRKSSQKKHSVSVASLESLMEMVGNPIMIFQRADNAVSFFTEIKDAQDRNVLVAVELNRKVQNGQTMLEVNDIRSLHGRDIQNIVLPVIENGTLKWVDKEKGLTYLSSAS